MKVGYKLCHRTSSKITSIPATNYEFRYSSTDSSVSSDVTISLGVCTKPTGISESPEELLRQADLQLYRAKEPGRNQVCAKLLHASLI